MGFLPCCEYIDTAIVAPQEVGRRDTLSKRKHGRAGYPARKGTGPKRPHVPGNQMEAARGTHGLSG